MKSAPVNYWTIESHWLQKGSSDTKNPSKSQYHREISCSDAHRGWGESPWWPTKWRSIRSQTRLRSAVRLACWNDNRIEAKCKRLDGDIRTQTTHCKTRDFSTGQWNPLEHCFFRYFLIGCHSSLRTACSKKEERANGLGLKRPPSNSDRRHISKFLCVYSTHFEHSTPKSFSQNIINRYWSE